MSFWQLMGERKFRRYAACRYLIKMRKPENLVKCWWNEETWDMVLQGSMCSLLINNGVTSLIPPRDSNQQTSQNTCTCHSGKEWVESTQVKCCWNKETWNIMLQTSECFDTGGWAPNWITLQGSGGTKNDWLTFSFLSFHLQTNQPTPASMLRMNEQQKERVE